MGASEKTASPSTIWRLQRTILDKARRERKALGGVIDVRGESPHNLWYTAPFIQ
jgi:hypothetical protein